MYLLKWILVMCGVVVPIFGDAAREVYHMLSKQMFTINHFNERSLFGYSVTYQQEKKSLIVSAPNATNIGEVYECRMEDRNPCSLINIPQDRVIPELDHHYLLGATVKAGSWFFMTCAPRVPIEEDLNGSEKRYGTLAGCYYGDTVTGKITKAHKIKKTARNQDINLQYPDGGNNFEYSMDSFGWSIDVSEDNMVLVGGPAMSTGRVMVFKNNKNTKTLSAPSLILVNNNHLRRISNASVSFNFGYSIASGNFFSATIITYAISSPYGDIGIGKVLFFSRTDLKFDCIIGKEIVDNELGSLFGAALCAAKLNGIQASLLVGAPAFAPGSPSSSVDLGAVHIYVNKNNTMQRIRTLKGYKDGGYFGYAIANVGDLNGDNKDEVVISAPYEADGRGVVYIFSGGDLMTNLPEVRWLQRIQAEGHGQNLGLSLSPLNDFDDNGCKELAIGIPGNSSVLLLRCMASVTVRVQATFPNLTTDLGATHFNLETCLNVTYPEKPKLIQTNIEMAIQLKHPNATIKDGETGNPRLLKYSNFLALGKPIFCRNITVILPSDGDYDQLLEFNITATPDRDPTKHELFHPQDVILSDQSLLTLLGSVQGPGSLLTMTHHISIPDQYLIGSTDTETITIDIKNTGNGAHSSCVRVRTIGVNVTRPPPNCGFDGELLTCRPHGVLRNSEQIKITLDTKSLTTDAEIIVLKIELFSYCKGPMAIQNLTKTIALINDVSKILIKENSVPGFIVNITKSEVQFGTQDISHIYTIYNKGISNWGHVKFDIKLPKDVSCSVSTDVSESCLESDLNATCEINQLQKDHKINIIIAMNVELGTFKDKILSGYGSIDTHLNVIIGNKTETRSISTKIHVQQAFVPLWIIIVASIVGLIILFIIAFILYECGFLRRKHKEELKDLKKSVKHQSVRRMRESINAVLPAQPPEDRQKLINLQEENEPANVELHAQHVAFKKTEQPESTQAEIH